MAATWVFNSINFVNQSRREVRAVATRTVDGVSKTYTVRSFIIDKSVPLGQQAANLAGIFFDLVQKDKSWDVPDIATMFPNADVVMKTKLEALES